MRAVLLGPELHPDRLPPCYLVPVLCLLTRSHTFRSFALLALFVASAAIAAAQTGAATGAIAGRVFNPATQEFVRNAEVAIAGTNLVTYTADDGSYSFTGVPRARPR